MQKEIYITSAVRTAVGSLGKSLKNISAEILGSKVITKAIKNLCFVRGFSFKCFYKKFT